MMDGDYPRTLPACARADVWVDMAFDEGSGQMAIDASQYGNHGAMIGMAENDWIPSPDNGRGFALDFDGGDDHILMNPLPIIGTGEFSYMARIRVDATPVVTDAAWFTQIDHPAALQGIAAWVNTLRQDRFLVRGAGGVMPINTSFTFTLGQVTHVVHVHEYNLVTGARVYEDAILRNSFDNTICGNINNILNTYLARRSLDNELDCVICDFKMLNRILQQSEITRLYDQPRMPLRDDEQCMFLGAVA